MSVLGFFGKGLYQVETSRDRSRPVPTGYPMAVYNRRWPRRVACEGP
jgi:hypothetical protein